jgi:hypothetical protein
MGKKTKEHRRKVAKRNARIQQEKNLMNKLYNEAMKISIDELKEKLANANPSESEITEITDVIAEEVVDSIINEPTQENAE